MKLIHLLCEDHFLPFSPNMWGGWLHISGEFIATRHQDGHWDKVDDDPTVFGFQPNANSDDLSWEDTFNNGWIRVVMEPKHNYMSLDGNIPMIKRALKSYAKIINKMFISRDIQQIEISPTVGVGGLTLQSRQKFNEFIRS
jgi:hypothetical protein